MPLAAGSLLGPYEILDPLGAGGMGEVYRAHDPRLGREVAVKVLPEEVARDPERLSRFEREGRAVAALNHPNILTVFDVGTHGGVPYVVTELLEGETLRELLARRAPTQRQVLFFLAQAAHGLEAAHAKGIVHRDVKPENLFVTVDGRVKLLDFGLAKQLDRLTSGSAEVTASSPTGAGQVLGTVAYMSPEQVRGLPVDHRTDLFSFGVVAYELLSGKHPFRRETTVATLTAILEETPSELVGLGKGVPPALSGIVQRCLAKGREERFRSAHDLALSLESVLSAPAGAASLDEVEIQSPYPGLASFTEKEAGLFFGREAEVAALWRRLQSRKLLAVIGPSGTGKTSFVRAGVIPARPEGWSAVCATPGSRPALGLAQALTPELAGDAEAISDLLRGVTELIESGESGRVVSAVKRWRARHGEALLVVDQFEELFTLSPKETQARFAALLGRLASEADVHVVLSLRDDFLIRCSEHEPLAPVFESLTPLPGLTTDGLRRALTEPAKKRGYRFEDEALVEEMVGSVEGARGALPLLAFAVARLWEKRDRERKLLTRAAYEEIGGVAGALAQHAEATMDRIGAERQGVVREIFRNLVTAHGTRAAADREELLSAFPQRKAAEEVLRELIDARLLTSYEVEGKEGEPSHHRVEIVHESLLKAWPRLVHWQTQDEEGAQLRDQLRQAAHLWEEKGRSPDLLWSGTAFREYELWRERYPGGLTAIEEAFAKAMAQRAARQRRLRRAAAGLIVATSLAVAVVTGVLWTRARDEALRAEAGKLLALGRAEIDRYPTAALAYVRRSLELADTPDARRFAVEVLWRGPVVRILSPDRVAGGPDQPENPGWHRLAFSPDGRWAALENGRLRRILVLPHDGGAPRTLPHPEKQILSLAFSPQSDLLVVGDRSANLRLWSLPDLRGLPPVEVGGISSAVMVRGDRLYTVTERAEGDPLRIVRSWTLPGWTAGTLGTFEWNGADFSLDPSGDSLVTVSGRSVRRVTLGRQPDAERVLGSHSDIVSEVGYFPAEDRVASLDQSGEIRIWSPDARTKAPTRVLRGMKGWGRLFGSDPDGRFVASAGVLGVDSLHLWDLLDPPDAGPAVLKWLDAAAADTPGGWFDASGRWVVMTTGFRLGFWPLASPRRRALPGYEGFTGVLAFTPDGRWLAACPQGQAIRLWPLSPASGEARSLWPTEPEFAPRGVLSGCNALAIHPAGTHVAVVTQLPFGVLLVPIAGGSSRRLQTGWGQEVFGGQVAFDPGGRRAAACPLVPNYFQDARRPALTVWDLESGRGRDVSLAPFTRAFWSCRSVAFAPDGAVLVAGDGGVLRVVLPDDPGGDVSAETLHPAAAAAFALGRDGRQLLIAAGGSPGGGVFEELLLFDLATRTSKRITTHGQRLNALAFDPSGRAVVTGDNDGVVRVGPVTGEEPHLLSGGHAGQVTALAVSPDGRWVASVSDGGSFHLWPMPDVTKPPLHTLPHAELMAKLDALTNLRVVRDPASSTGWKFDLGPFPGWKDVPTW
jgi:WD40 repeat protein